jgi:mannitol/fructose-specific phosphotransferase system IIA component (Ntr-type)
MLISDYLQKTCISTHLEANSKTELLDALAAMQFKQYPELDPKEARAGLLEREKLLSTGIGHGVAIPHARLDSSRQITLSLGLLEREIGFDALDGQPVRIVLLVFFPKDAVNLQLRFLARVSRLLHQEALREDLMTCSDPAAIIDTFKRFEASRLH